MVKAKIAHLETNVIEKEVPLSKLIVGATREIAL